MSAFANLPISRKLMAAFAAVVVVVFASSAIVFDRLRVIEWAHDWRVHTIDVLDTLQNAMDAMLDQETGLRGYLITGDEKFLEPYHRGGNAYTAAIQKLRDLATDNPALQSRLDELNELARKWRSGFAERAIALMAKFETREDARALEGSTAGKTAMDLIRAKVHEIEGAERDLLAKRDAVQRQAFANCVHDDDRRWRSLAHHCDTDGCSTHARHRGADHSHDQRHDNARQRRYHHRSARG